LQEIVVTRAVIRFLDFTAVPELRLTVSNGGDERSMRKIFRAATNNRRVLVKFGLHIFIPYFITKLAKRGLVSFVFENVATDLSYTVSSDESGAVTLQVSGRDPRVRNKARYRGPLFSWLGNYQHYPRTTGPQKLRGALKQRNQARVAREREAMHLAAKTRFFTPQQLEYRKHTDIVKREHLHRSEGAKRRHERRKLTPKMTIDEMVASARGPITPKVPRILSVDFQDVCASDAENPDDQAELDAIYRDITTNK
jgi:hypothetical protein